MTPLVSIVIPTYNRAHLITETLDSILGQTYSNWECIIVDDGSIDNTQELVEGYVEKDERFKFLHRPVTKPKGPSSSRNYGLQNAEGNYVIFLDSDDLLAKKCLENRIVFALKHPENELWIFKVKIFENQVNDREEIFNLLPTKDIKEEIFYLKNFYKGKFPFVVMCPLWKKEALLKIRGFDEKLLILEDPDLHLRAFKEKYKSTTAFDLEADCFYRKTKNSESQIKRKTYKEVTIDSHFYFLQKHLDKHISDSVYRYKNIYNLYVFNKKSFSLNSKMIKLGKEKGVITNFHILLSYIILIAAFMKIDKIKGLGYHSLRKQFNKLKVINE